MYLSQTIHRKRALFKTKRFFFSFYPNGGKAQPGCGHDFAGSCAHIRSYDLFVESLYAPKLLGFECDSFENLQKGNCSVVNEVVQMGGEPGNKR